MLKAQLRSKLALADLHEWQDCEDILTGEFFGVLDYLPRRPYLLDFLADLERINNKPGILELEQVDWDAIEMFFWRRCALNNQTTEPDVILASSRWVIVIEVKLQSGLGETQPWREFCVGRQLAAERGIDPSAVHYLVVSRERLSTGRVLEGLTVRQRGELEPHTLFLRWSEAAALVDRWQDRIGERPVAPNEARMLADLRAAMRRRRTLSFSGFSFLHERVVDDCRPPIFAPPRFSGFLSSSAFNCRAQPTAFFLRRFDGFLLGARQPVSLPPEPWLRRFRGLGSTAPVVPEPPARFFCPPKFAGFLNRAPACEASAVLRLAEATERVPP